MSIQAMSTCWGPEFPAEAEGLSPQTIRIVALAIADIVNDVHGNEFYASLTNLGIKVGCTRKTIRVVIQHLVDRGVMEEVRQNPGRPTTYRWILGVPKPLPVDNSRGPGGVGRTDPPVGRTDPGGGYLTTHHKTNRYSKEPRRAPSSEISGRRDYDSDPEDAETVAERWGIQTDFDGKVPEWAERYGPPRPIQANGWVPAT